MKYVRLEYNEYQGCFHFNYGYMPPNTNNWMTICDNLSYQQCVEFTELIIKKYPSINPFNHSINIAECPSLELIKQEFADFLLT